MKKDRNTFFQEAQMSNYNYFPNPNMNLMSANMPTQASQSSQAFYAGPGSPIMPNIQEDIESRLAKLERQVNRLETRINKLESLTSYSNDDIDVSTNMYMV